MKAFPLTSISALIRQSDLLNMSLNQTKRAEKRGIIARRPEKQQKDQREAHAAIQRLVNWQKEYGSLYERWLKSVGTSKASQLKAKLNKYEEIIDGHIEAFGIRVDSFSDGYFYNPKSRIRIERDEFHPKHVNRLSDNTAKDRQKRIRLKHMVSSYHERIAELEEERALNGDDVRVLEDVDRQVKRIRTLILEKNREITRL